MPKQIYQGIEFDSSEEVQFFQYLLELQELGYIEKIIPQPKPFELLEKQTFEVIIPMKRVENKVKQKTFVNAHIYTPDFKVTWTKKMTMDLFAKIIDKEIRVAELFAKKSTYFEVKPIFDQNNMTRLAKINIKWVYQKHNIMVQMVIPSVLFSKTFTPVKALKTTTGKERKIKHKVVLIQEFLK